MSLAGPFDGFRLEIDADRNRADIILDRPPLNVVSMAGRDQLAAVFAELDRLDAVRAVVVRSAGPHFCSGGNIAGFMEQTPEHVSQLAHNIAAPERLRKPVIAAIRGYCFGVGFELALACDFRIVSETALLSLPEQRIGMIPGSGGSIRLLHSIGLARTKDVVMRSRRITGQEARDWGIAVDVVADGELDAATDALAADLVTISPLAQRTAKALLNTAQDAPVHVGIELEGQAYGRLRSSDDFREGVDAFTTKRKPNFTGR